MMLLPYHRISIFVKPKIVPIVTPDVAPTNIPFFHPSINTINMLSIVLISNPNMLMLLKLEADIASNILAPITSSIEKAFFILNSFITIIEFTNIL